MGSIFGFALLNNNTVNKNSLITIATELIRTQTELISSVNLVISSEACINILQKNVSITELLTSKEFTKFIDTLGNGKVFSFIGSTEHISNEETFTKYSLSISNNTVSVQKELTFNRTGEGGKLVSEIINKYFNCTLGKIKQTIKDVNMYAAINALCPDTLLLAKHMPGYLETSMFANYGIFIFSSSQRSMEGIKSKLFLGKEELISMQPNQAYIMNMLSNTYKISTI